MPLSPPIQIRFTPAQLARLSAVRNETGLSFGEQVRKLVDADIAVPKWNSVTAPPPPLERQTLASSGPVRKTLERTKVRTR